MTNSGQSRSELKAQGDHYREELEAEIEELAGLLKKGLSSALLIGGTMVLSYVVYKGAFGKKKKKVEHSLKTGSKEISQSTEIQTTERPSLLHTVKNVVATEIIIFLLAIAKEKLTEYLKSLEDEEQKSA